MAMTAYRPFVLSFNSVLLSPRGRRLAGTFQTGRDGSMPPCLGHDPDRRCRPVDGPLRRPGM